MAQNGQPSLVDQLRVYIAADSNRNQAYPLLREFLAQAQKQSCAWDGIAIIRYTVLSRHADTVHNTLLQVTTSHGQRQSCEL